MVMVLDVLFTLKKNLWLTTAIFHYPLKTCHYSPEKTNHSLLATHRTLTAWVVTDYHSQSTDSLGDDWLPLTEHGQPGWWLTTTHRALTAWVVTDYHSQSTDSLGGDWLPLTEHWQPEWWLTTTHRARTAWVVTDHHSQSTDSLGVWLPLTEH